MIQCKHLDIVSVDWAVHHTVSSFSYFFLQFHTTKLMKFLFSNNKATRYISICYAYDVLIKWAPSRKILLSVFASNKGADQSAHPCRLISAFVIRSLESTLSKLDTDEVSIFYQVSVTEAWFESRFPRNPEGRFCHDEAQYYKGHRRKRMLSSEPATD